MMIDSGLRSLKAVQQSETTEGIFSKCAKLCNMLTLYAWFNKLTS